MSTMGLKSPASRLFTQTFIQAEIKETSKLRVIGLCEWNPLVTAGFPSQRSSNAENVSIWWRLPFRFYCETTTWYNQSQNDQISQFLCSAYFVFQNEQLGYMSFLYWTMTVIDRYGLLHTLWTSAKWMPWLAAFELHVIHTFKHF